MLFGLNFQLPGCQAHHDAILVGSKLRERRLGGVIGSSAPASGRHVDLPSNRTDVSVAQQIC